MSKKETASPVLKVDEEGYIELHVGSPDNLITQLGRRGDGTFKPWSLRTANDISLFCPFVVSDGYYPTNFPSSTEFIKSLRDQAYNNPYVDNYVEMGMEHLIKFLNESMVVDSSTKYLFIDNNSDLTEIMHDKVNGVTNNAFNGIVSLRDQINPDMIFVNEDAPREAKEYFQPILDELQKVDAYYSFEELNFDKKMLKFLSGFSIIDYENMSDITPKDDIVLACDVYTTGYTYSDVLNQLKNNGYKNIIGFISLIKQI